MIYSLSVSNPCIVLGQATRFSIPFYAWDIPSV